MAMIFTQTDSPGSACVGNTEMVACSGLTAGFPVGYTAINCTVGGTAGTGVDDPTVASSATAAEVALKLDVPAGTSWDAGDYTVRMNVTTANMNLTISSIYLCRVDSACTNQATIGSATGLSISLASTGVVSQVVTGSAQTPSVGDFILIVLGLTNGAMSSQQVVFTQDQNIDTPLSVVVDRRQPPVNRSFAVMRASNY